MPGGKAFRWASFAGSELMKIFIAALALCWLGGAARAADGALATKFPRARAVLPLVVRFPLLASLLEAEKVWELDPPTLKAGLLPQAVTLQQGSDRNPLLFSAQRSPAWPGLPVW